MEVVVSDNTVRISHSNLQVFFSPTDDLTITVGDDASVCGACGTVTPPAKQGDLKEKTLVSFLGTVGSASLNIGQWTAPDFPQW